MVADKDFGKITFKDDYGHHEWTGKLMIPFISRSEEVEIVIWSNSKKEISDKQRAIFKKVLTNHQDFFNEVRQAIFDQYHRARKLASEIDSWHPDDFEEIYPNIKTPEELIPLYNRPSIELFNDDSEKEVFGIGHWCEWDQEYGSGLRFENWKVANVGNNPEGMWG